MKPTSAKAMVRKPFWFLRRRSVASDVDEELNLHLDMKIADLRARGLSAADARAEAIRQFGDLERTREYCRRQDEQKEKEMQRSLMLQDFLQDARIGIRSLMRVPVLTLTIIATVGIGIGATAAIFSAIDAALLRPLPYAQPERLVRIYTDTPPFKFRLSVADYLTFLDQQRQFAQSATYTDRSMVYSDTASADVLRVRVVSWGFFSMLGVAPQLGRDFSEADGRVGAPLTVLASNAFWQQRLGARSDVIGKPIKLDGGEYMLIGVLPPRAGVLERRMDLFLIQQFAPPPRKGPFFYSVVARLRDGVNPTVAADELHAINKAMFATWKASYQDDKATWSMQDLKTNLVGNVNTIAAVSLASVALVWLIACANASNLLIARVTGRRQELAVRSALGASRGRVIRYLLAESAVLATGAVLLGAGVTWAGIQLLQGVGATYLPRTSEIAFDSHVWWLLAGLAVFSALIFGSIPALHAAGDTRASSLQSLGRSTGSPVARRLRRALVAAQFAIATPLLIVAALLVGSLNQLRQVDLGFEHEHVITGSIRLAAALYQDPAKTRVFWDELTHRITGVPGVAGVAYADGLPPNNVGNRNNFDLEDFPAGPGQSQPTTPWVATTPEYVRVLGLKLLEGRLLDDRDAAGQNLLSVMVDRAWQKRFFPNGSAVGKRFREGGCTTCPWTTVVGVVSEVKYAGLDKPDDGTVYTSMGTGGLSRFLVVRTQGDPLAVTPSLQQIVRDLDPAAPLSNVATVDNLIDQSLQQPQTLSRLIASFALVALLLSIVGIYGVMGYYVQQSRKEISIRMALGGSAGDVLKLVVGQGMQVVGAGVVVGLMTALAMSRLVASLLFGVGAADPATFALVSVALVVMALAACLLPARRAIRIQPASVLRMD
jgi:predicted permease